MIVQIFLAIIASVALVGNLLVVMLLLKKRDWLKKVHSCLLLALAVQDILTAIGILVLPGFVQPSNIYTVPQSTTLGQWFCGIIWSRYIPFALAITSVYTCLMLAFDRWCAVFRPVSYKRFSVSVRVIAMMVTLPWIAGFGFEINTALNVNHVVQSNETYTCRWNKITTSARGGIIAIFTFTGMSIKNTSDSEKLLARTFHAGVGIQPFFPDPCARGAILEKFNIKGWVVYSLSIKS